MTLAEARRVKRAALAMSRGWGGRFVDQDRGGSFRQPYPSVAVMNAQSFLPPLRGYGEAEADARLSLCGTSTYRGLELLAVVVGALVLGPKAYALGKKIARG